MSGSSKTENSITRIPSFPGHGTCSFFLLKASEPVKQCPSWTQSQEPRVEGQQWKYQLLRDAIELSGKTLATSKQTHKTFLDFGN